MQEKVLSRSTAILIVIAATVGDGLLLNETVTREHAGWFHAIWTDLMFFSDLSNLLVVIVFLMVGFQLLRERRPWWLGLTLTSILLTCIGAQGWRGVSRPMTGNTLVHTWVPLAVALWCLAFATKGRLRWMNLVTWGLVPIAYLTYALGRGALTGVYPYPWLDSSKAGLASVAVSAVLQIALFVVTAICVLLADTFWPKRWSARAD